MDLFTTSLLSSPSSQPLHAPLYTSRAQALLERGWEGDCMAALWDADQAVALDPGCSRPYLLQAQALGQLHMLKVGGGRCRESPSMLHRGCRYGCEGPGEVV